MTVEGISSVETDCEAYESTDEMIGSWDGKEVRELSSDDQKVPAPHVVLKTRASLHNRSVHVRPMGGRVGGGVSAETDKDGNTEVSAEGHGSYKSDDGNTSATVSGSASVNDRGEVSTKVEARVEYEW